MRRQRHLPCMSANPELAEAHFSAASAASRLRALLTFLEKRFEFRIHDTSVGVGTFAATPLAWAAGRNGAKRISSAGSWMREGSRRRLRAVHLVQSLQRGARSGNSPWSFPSQTPSNSFRSNGIPISESTSIGSGALVARCDR
jgi:hypothetical protein